MNNIYIYSLLRRLPNEKTGAAEERKNESAGRDYSLPLMRGGGDAEAINK